MIGEHFGDGLSRVNVSVRAADLPESVEDARGDEIFGEWGVGEWGGHDGYSTWDLDFLDCRLMSGAVPILIIQGEFKLPVASSQESGVRNKR